MPDRLHKKETEPPAKAKVCKSCGNSFEWQKKLAKDRDAVQCCSGPCLGDKPSGTCAALEATILGLLAERGPDKTICPSEAAKAVGGIGWRDLMGPARAAARRLVAEGKIVVTQGGRVVDAATAKGAIRLKLR